jgi:hypothetical protein
MPMTPEQRSVAVRNTRQWAAETADPRKRAAFLRLADGLARGALIKSRPEPREALTRPTDADALIGEIREMRGTIVAPTVVFDGGVGGVDQIAELQDKIDRLAQSVAAPKRIVRDKDGRSIGVEPVEMDAAWASHHRSQGRKGAAAGRPVGCAPRQDRAAGSGPDSAEAHPAR